MITEIISVGTELLLGQILNTNAQYLAIELSQMGLDVYYQTTVGDNPTRMKETINRAINRSDIIILTGGLGPTQDDITKFIVAESLGLEMEEDQQTIDWLKSMFNNRGWEMTPNNLRQAMFPVGAHIFENKNGTAPGCVVESGEKSIIVLPGPPREMKPMFNESVKPCLEEKSGFVISSRILRVFGVGESRAEHKIRDIIDNQTNPTVAPYAATGEVTLRITAKCKKDENPVPMLNEMESKIRERLGEAVYAVDAPSMPYVVANMLKDKNMKLAIAESCTGGLLSSAFVDLPGASEILIEGVVCYSNKAKVKRLGVKNETLNQFGEVSAETAREMAFGAIYNLNADASIAVTGIAGPDGGSDEKPVGLVYIAVCVGGDCTVKELNLWGDRDRIRNVSVLNAVNELRIKLLS